MSSHIRWTEGMYLLDAFSCYCLGYCCFNLGANFGLMVSVNYKTYVKADLLDDHYLTMIGSVGAIACSLSRLLWGSIL